MQKCEIISHENKVQRLRSATLEGRGRCPSYIARIEKLKPPPSSRQTKIREDGGRAIAIDLCDRATIRLIERTQSAYTEVG